LQISEQLLYIGGACHAPRCPALGHLISGNKQRSLKSFQRAPSSSPPPTLLALVKNVSFRFVAPAKIESKGAKKKGERGRREGLLFYWHWNISIYGSLTLFQCYVLWIFAHCWARSALYFN